MSEPTAYDVVGYPSVAATQTHPDRIAAIARLHGVQAPRPSSARVLELGCASGQNLLGIAYALPDVSCVGVDSAASAIEQARAGAAAARIENVRFEVADLAELASKPLGEFDYVLAHGVYAWVDEPTQDALLVACARHLAPDGIVYVSYNAHPGGHAETALREIGLWHARGVTDPLARVERARVFLALLAQWQSAGDSGPYAGAFADILEAVAGDPLPALRHDIFADDWRPVWFADFVAHAGAHGLRYLAEAWPRRPQEPWLEKLVSELGGGDRIAREQYEDLLRFRRFRSTLLCRAERWVQPHVERATLASLRFIGRNDPDSEAGELARAVAAWLAAHGPAAVGFAELRAALGAAADPLAVALLDAAGHAIVVPWVDGPRAARPGERPRASALARWQAGEGLPLTTLINDHVAVDDEASRTLVTLLDGTRDRAAIAADLEAATGQRRDPDALERDLEALALVPLLEG